MLTVDVVQMLRQQSIEENVTGMIAWLGLFLDARKLYELHRKYWSISQKISIWLSHLKVKFKWQAD